MIFTSSVSATTILSVITFTSQIPISVSDFLMFMARFLAIEKERNCFCFPLCLSFLFLFLMDRECIPLFETRLVSNYLSQEIRPCIWEQNEICHPACSIKQPRGKKLPQYWRGAQIFWATLFRAILSKA